MQRIGSVLKVTEEGKAEYIRLHAAVWPAVLAKIADCNIRNYSIFLREPENLLFSYYEYHGDDHEADLRKMAADPTTQEWWAINRPLQRPLEAREDGTWSSDMHQIFYFSGEDDMPKEG